MLPKYLGVSQQEYEAITTDNRVGVAVGMAYNEAGGDLLEIEVRGNSWKWGNYFNWFFG